MRPAERVGKILVVAGALGLSGFLAQSFGSGGLWYGFRSQIAASKPGAARKYDLTRLEAVNQTLKLVRDRYVDPDRVHPKEMLLSALNQVQRDVAQVIVLPNADKPGYLTIRVDTEQTELKIDDVLGPWDVAAKLREAFAFMQKNLANAEGVDLRELEYAACNGILRTLDPHSVFMSPDAYREMNLSTSGHFGGLGIVISLRDQLLTVIRPMPDTPAVRAGLKKYDRILKINNESTLNMPLDDAVRRLRGKPGSKVSVWVARPNEWEGAREFVLTREQIRVPSVIAKRLQGDVAYVRLKQFQQTSSEEIKEQLSRLRAEGPISGVVLDLRGNPGGLLDQAAKVADIWIRNGTLVATVGASEGREEKRASGAENEPDYPLVVLVNQSSASASEIVAGALKNLKRAVIVGETTFGKGSVQLVFPDVTPDKAALKLTIAQYLTPGDQSIQGVGVTPHIELDPMTVDPLEMDLTLQHDGVRERDLEHRLSNERAAKPASPAQVVRYYLPQRERETMRELGGELDEEFQVDFPIEFARELTKQLPPNQPAESQLSAAASSIESTRQKEIGKVTEELKKLEIDWSVPSAKTLTGPTKDDFTVAVSTDHPGDVVQAGEALNLTVSVTNKGKEPVYRLRAVTESDNAFFNEKELVFGKIAPGETKTSTVPLSWCEIEGRKIATTAPLPKDAKRVCKLPKEALDRSDGVKIHFDALEGHTPATAELRPTIEALPRPQFQYSYQIADNLEGSNGDGLIQRGEMVTVFLTVKNVGKGRSLDTQANLANRSGDGVLLKNGRFQLDAMDPGAVREVAFTFEVQPQLAEEEVVLGLSVGDRDLREFANEKIRIPVRPKATLEAQRGTVTAKEGTMLYGDVAQDRPPFGVLPAGAVLPVVGRSSDPKRGTMTKVMLAPERFAFLKEGTFDVGGQAPSANDAVAYLPMFSHAPPALVIKAAERATRGDKVRIDVEATDSERLLDMYLFVGSRKLHYQSNRNGADPKRATFSFEAPLQPGVNLISVIARESPDTTTARTVVVRRDAPDGSILKTPKHQDDDFLGDGGE
jgi:carboxyl-terminal processing protease